MQPRGDHGVNGDPRPPGQGSIILYTVYSIEYRTPRRATWRMPENRQPYHSLQINFTAGWHRSPRIMQYEGCMGVVWGLYGGDRCPPCIDHAQSNGHAIFSNVRVLLGKSEGDRYRTGIERSCNGEGRVRVIAIVQASIMQ